MKDIILSPITIEDLEARLQARVNESLKTFLNEINPANQLQPDKDILTFKEGCRFLNIAEATGYTKVSKRQIPFIKRGKFIYFSKKQLTEWLLAGEKKTVSQLENDTVVSMSKSKSK